APHAAPLADAGGAQALDAAPEVLRRVAGGAGAAILLDGREAVVAAQRVADGVQVEPPVADGAERSGVDGVPEVARPRAGCQVLEVDVSWRVAADQGGGIRARVERVAGVEAEPEAGAFEDALDLVLEFDVAAGVRMHDGVDAPLPRPGSCLAEQLEHRR